MDWMKDKALKLAMLSGFIYSGCGLNMWGFNEEGKLYYTTSPYEKELEMFLRVGGCMEYALKDAVHFEYPFIMSDSMGLTWVGEYVSIKENKLRMLVILGPIFNMKLSMKNIEDGLRRQNISLALRHISLQVLPQVPILPVLVMNQYVQMLHYAIAEENIFPNQFIYQNPQKDEQEMNIDNVYKKHFMEYEWEFSSEETIMQCIKEGNINYKNIVDTENKSAITESLGLNEPLRESKDIILIFTASCSRAAIEGKLPIKTAKDLERKYIRFIEKCKTITELMDLRRMILDEYVMCVYESQLNSNISLPIRLCCEYIKAHFMEALTLKDIAKNVGYTEYYLTRKFQKEIGIKLLDYIKKIRLEYAKVWLITTEKSIQDISEQLHFATRNHFSKTFKEKEGMSPADYRERIRNIGRK